MKFINTGKKIKVQINETDWRTLQKGDTVNLPEHYGKNLGLEEVKAEESKAGPKKVETKKRKTRRRTRKYAG